MSFEEVKEIFKKSIDTTDTMNQAIENLIQSIYLKGYNDALKNEDMTTAYLMGYYADKEPCKDEYIKVPKKALKYRTAGMVAYNAEWLKNHFDIERAVICGAQQPSDDAISRQAVLDVLRTMYDTHIVETEDGDEYIDYNDTVYEIEQLPSVNPQPKTGHWIDDKCSVCGKGTEDLISSSEWYGNEEPNFCPFCGTKMEVEE